MIYLDCHATTRCDSRVVDAMLPWLSRQFGNPHSSHAMGREASEAIEQATAKIARLLGAKPDAVVFTSGATESNNLAIRGICTHPRQKRRHIVTVATEHPAVLDVVENLRIDGFRVTVVPVADASHADAGIVDLDRLADSVDDDTALVSVMWANNEIGAIAPMKTIAEICHSRGALLHSDATQAVGRLPIDVMDEDVDLLSASAHKFYGPKGAGVLVVGNSHRRVRLRPQIIGGGQQHGLRSGTMNPAAVIGITTALQLCTDEMSTEQAQIGTLRDRLTSRLANSINGLTINGPKWTDGTQTLPATANRLAGNLNLMVPKIEGEAWMAAVPELAFSTGSACSNIEPVPSHVLTALGLSESMARRSVRFGIGRFNTSEEIDSASDMLIEAYERIARLM